MDKELRAYKEFTPDMPDRIRGLISCLRHETMPIEGHTDPIAIKDCWDSLSEMVNCVLVQEELLRNWKESAISVMPDYQAIGKEMNVKLGDSVHDKILPYIQKLKAARTARTALAKHEEILSKYVESPLWQNVLGSEIVTKENALKAMQEVSREQPLREVADGYETACNDVLVEVRRAKTMFKENFHNQHEGYAVILEEIDELWEEVKKNQRNYDLKAQRKEAIQCAAMCVRFIAELTPPQNSSI